MTYLEHREKIFNIAQKFVSLGLSYEGLIWPEGAIHCSFLELLDACKEAQADRENFMAEMQESGVTQD